MIQILGINGKFGSILFILLLLTLLHIYVLMRNELLTSANSKIPKIDDLAEQKRIFNLQASDRQSLNRLYRANIGLLHYGIVPQIYCPTMVRLGNAGDGGKWVCNPWRAPENCVIYSIGIAFDVSFEIGLLNAVGVDKCKLYGFDPDQKSGIIYKTRFPGAEFRPWIIGNSTDPKKNQQTLNEIMNFFGHTKIDFLKMDIEGHEFEAISAIVDELRIPAVPICQLMIEVHTDSTKHLSKFMELIENARFLLFSKEANTIGCRPPCFEYAWIHRTCLPQYGLDAGVVVLHNFPDE